FYYITAEVWDKCGGYQINDYQCPTSLSPYTVQQVTATSAVVKWTGISPALQHYEVEVKKQGNVTWDSYATDAPHDSLMLVALQPNTIYEYRIIWYCDTSQPASGMTSTDTFSTRCEVPQGLSTTHVGSNTARLNWTPDNAADGYDILLAPVGGTIQAIQVSGGNAGFYYATGLIANTTYTWRIRKQCQRNSEYSGAQSFTTLSGGGTGGGCLPVDTIWTTRITPTSARLNWTDATVADGYQIRGRGLGVPSWTYLTFATTQGRKDVSGLPYNIEIEWQMRRLCNAGADTSIWSGLDTFKTVCQPPDSVWTGPVTSSGARLNWKRVVGAVGYEIRGRRSGGTWINLLAGGGTTTSKDVFGLQAATIYNWKIRSWCDVNGIAKSVYSVTDTFMTNSGARMRGSDNHSGFGTQDGIMVYPNPSRGVFIVTGWFGEDETIGLK
ncbi:MAG: hypothetical protein D6706_05805, partial [Chloroflexi bacterium]